MFTGIIQTVGTVTQIEQHGADIRLSIQLNELVDQSTTDPGSPGQLVALGESIAVNGVCLTVAREDAGTAEFDVSAETLALTNMSQWQLGTRVNLERALQAHTRLGGHFVSGHVDGLGRLSSLHDDGRSTRMRFELPGELARFITIKGSITVDGVSLTVNGVEDARTAYENWLFNVNLVPHTLSATTLGDLQAGDRVHLEVDMIARYLARLMAFQSADELSNVSER